MRTKIELKGIHFQAFHGYYEEERIMGNNFIVNVEVYVDSFDDLGDSIDKTVNYEGLFLIFKKVMSKSEKLLETVLLRMIHMIKEEYTHIKEGKVTIEKIGPQLGGKVDKAIITMEF